SSEQLAILAENIRQLAPEALVVEADSSLTLDGEIQGKSVLVVEDGPTLTHGEMTIGAASVAARRFGALEVADPRPQAVGKIRETYEIYPNIGAGILPAMGYSEQQRKDLETTINTTKADLVLSGTPIDLGRIVNSNKPIVRVRYDLNPHKSSAEILPRALKTILFS
ncbi:GTPase, partial [bacterium]|nr:GTPase [bacterium]